MLICVLGTPQSGKNSLANHLVDTYDFTRVYLGSASLPPDASSNALAFPSSSAFLDFVTQTWRKNYVTTDIRRRTKLEEYAKRPFVAIVSVQAPLGVRFKRAVATAQRKGLEELTLDEFVAADDAILYGPTELPTPPPVLQPGPPSTPKQTTNSLRPNEPPSPVPSPSRSSSSLPTLSDSEPLLPLLRELSNISLLNPHSTFAPFFSTLSLPAVNDSLRPPWDAYFMRLASLASLRSNCMKRRVGCVLVRERRVVSTGYNGTPRGVRNCNEGGCLRCNSYGNGLGEGEKGTQMAMGVGLDECLCLHAEENALLEAREPLADFVWRLASSWARKSQRRWNSWGGAILQHVSLFKLSGIVLSG
ncbi:dCMP deaminase, partial [Phenoliferia sp. Uapishka_3]